MKWYVGCPWFIAFPFNGDTNGQIKKNGDCYNVKGLDNLWITINSKTKTLIIKKVQEYQYNKIACFQKILKKGYLIEAPLQKILFLINLILLCIMF